jgi:hypothetical protein
VIIRGPIGTSGVQGRRWKGWRACDSSLRFVLLSAFAILLWAASSSHAAVVINEIMASNAATLADPQGDFDDWIELYNAGATPVDLGGMYLTDDPDVPTKWQIPLGRSNATTIAPHGYLIVWADGEVGDAGLHASFRLSAGGDEVHLFDRDGVTPLDAVVFGQQTVDVSYGRYPNGGDAWRFSATPTPGQPNDEGYIGEVAPLRFSHERGFYTAPFNLVITTTTPDVNIIYTLDGRAPDELGYRDIPGKEYTGPIVINRTIGVRAMAFKPGWKPTAIYTHTYVFDTRTQVKSLPIIALVGDPGQTFYEPDGVMAIVGGTYSGGVWTSTGANSYNNPLNRDLERPVSAEWIPADDDADFQVDCGLRVHGSPYIRPRYVRQNGLWSGNGKFSLRLYFRGEYGLSRLEYPLFPLSNAEEFATVVLRAGHNDQVNPFIKDELLRRLHRDMGQVACMGTFANLLINGEWKGYYNPTEQVKEESCQQWFHSDKAWDVISMNGVRDGDSQSFNAMIDYARTHNLGDPAAYAEMLGRVDMVSFIDYLIIRLWPNDWDWPQNNWAAACERSTAGRWKFFVWDAEGTFESGQLQLDRFTSLNGSEGNNVNGYLYRALKANKDFRLLFADRVYKHFYNGGALTPENIQRRFNEMQAELKGVIPSMSTYIIDGWTPNRLSVFLNACTREGMFTFPGPTFTINGMPQYGGPVAGGRSLEIISSRSGLPVQYTLDGTDPAETGTPVKPAVLSLVTRESSKRVLVPTSAGTGDWRSIRAYNDTAWTLSAGYPGGIGYERGSGYESYISTDVGAEMYDINGSCYIRIPFVFADDESKLTAMTLKVQYDDGFVAYLNGAEIARRNFDGEPAWNSTGTAGHDDTAAVLFEAIDVSGSINRLRRGDNLLAIHALNVSTTSSDFLLTVELSADRQVEAPPENPTSATVYAGPIPLTRSTRVRARVQNGNTWSALSDATFAVGPVLDNLRISEIMYHPTEPNAEYIELTNIGAETINLNLVRFTRGIDFTFPDFELAPGGFCLVVRDPNAFAARYGPGLPVAGRYTGSLDNDGERIELQDAAGAIIHTFAYRADWFPMTDGWGFSLTVRDPAGAPSNSWGHQEIWRPSAMPEGTPGANDGGALEPGAVVINELLANSAGGGPDWIELHNTTDRALDIGGWFLSDDGDNLVKYEIAAGTVIAPQGYLVFSEDHHFGSPSDPGCHEPFGLSRNGETVYLHSGVHGVLTGYSDRAAFGPSEPGVTFGRCSDGAGRFSLAALTAPTPGTSNADPVVGPIVISEIMYHADDSTDMEYVELLNISDEPVTFYDSVRGAPWRFTDGPDNPGIDLLFPADPPFILEPHRYLVLVKDRILFESRFSIAASASVLEWGMGSLSNAGATIQVSRPGDLDDQQVRSWICVDRITYSDGSHHDRFPAGLDPWPPTADGQGMALTRTVTDSYGNDVRLWRASPPSPGGVKLRLDR